MILFNNNSVSNISREFKVDRQITVTAFGLAPGDSVEFELLRGHMALIPGSPCNSHQQFVIDQATPLSCGNGQQRVKLTPERSVIIIDSPQGEYLRAKYTGSTLNAINVSFSNSTVVNVTDNMRGCLTCCPTFAGETGATGPAGEAGPVGPTGSAGPIGLTGAVGPAGPTGLTGPTGPAGASGPAGAQGPNGATGATGPQGPIGATGSMGPAGAVGPAGPAGANGLDGAAGADSTVPGPAGADGATGPAGADGATGPAGADGATGPTGPTGPAGATGGATVAGAGIEVTGVGETGDPYVVSAPAPTLVVSAPAAGPTAAPADPYARNFAVSTVDETWEYLPGIGWRVVADRFTTELSTSSNIPTIATTWTTANSFVAHRDGNVVVTSLVTTGTAVGATQSGGIAINGVFKTYDNDAGMSPVGTSTGSHASNGNNAASAWSGAVVAGDIITNAGITIGVTGNIEGSRLTITYVD
jgi:Collagen triple helix repeat (20 copies)